MRRRLFTNQISDAIVNLLDTSIDLQYVKTIMKGNLSLLPPPESLQDFLPAILVEINDVTNIDASSDKNIMTSLYTFNIKYLKYYDIDNSINEFNSAIETSEIIADALLDDDNLQSVLNPYGRILKTEVPYINFSTSETEFFKDLDVPVIMTELEYIVYFRTFRL